MVKEGVSTNTLNIKIALNNIYEGGKQFFFGKNLSALRETQGKYLSQKYANDWFCIIMGPIPIKSGLTTKSLKDNIVD